MAIETSPRTLSNRPSSSKSSELQNRLQRCRSHGKEQGGRRTGSKLSGIPSQDGTSVTFKSEGLEVMGKEYTFKDMVAKKGSQIMGKAWLFMHRRVADPKETYPNRLSP